MQNQTLTSFLHQIKQEQREPHNDDEGFADEQMQSLIIPKHQILDPFSLTKQIQRKSKIKYREPKLKLTFISNNKNSQSQLRKNIIKKQNQQINSRSLELNKKQSKASVYNQLISQCVTKIKRTAIGQNIMIPNFSFEQSKNVKAFILNQNATIHYETPRQTNTHGYLRSYGLHLIDKDMNELLKIKLKDSFIMPKKHIKRNKQDFQFNSQFQSANLQIVAEVGQNEYDVYLKNDTNTHGHQTWFNFRVKNNKLESAAIKINICNIKRDLKLLQDHPKIYTRKVNEVGCALEDWKAEGNHLEFKVNFNNKFSNSKLELQSNAIYDISLLPAYTYSDMIRDISLLSNDQCVKIETLTYSLVGLAIPIITFTNPLSTHHKNVILVNCRIHPGQTNASFICKGLIKQLSLKKPQVKQFLDRNIIKIIPILNPDGVVMGNFRTNFLGFDLNRSFDSDDEIINPEIIALKQIGMKLKRQYGDKFNLFLDLHGHSSQKNIFTYGPDYETTETNFYQIRLLPKLFNAKSSLFKYYSCTFKLEDYKRNTARGFFLNKVGVSAYTIQASYNCYNDEGKSLHMGIKQWITFGSQMVGCLNLLYKLNKLSMIRNKNEIRKALNEADKEQIEFIKKFKKEFKKQKQQNILNMKHQKKKNGQDEDSDGQNECQDYNTNQRQEAMRRVAEVIMPNIILPRVIKPTILYPTVTPKLFKIRDQFQSSNLKIIFTRRGSKYSSLRMQGSHYIHSIKGIEMLKSEVKNLIH